MLPGDEERPTNYYLPRIDSLTHDRKDVADEFETFLATEIKANELIARGDKAGTGSGDNA